MADKIDYNLDVSVHDNTTPTNSLEIDSTGRLSSAIKTSSGKITGKDEGGGIVSVDMNIRSSETLINKLEDGVTAGRYAKIGANKAQVMYNIIHDKIHDGLLFHGSLSANIGSGVQFYTLFGTPADKEVHLFYKIISGKVTTVEFYEGPTVTDPGVALSSYNFNRTISDTHGLLVYTGATLSGLGTRLTKYTNPPNTVVSIDLLEGVTEWVLPASSIYMLRIISGGADNDVSFVWNFYEV